MVRRDPATAHRDSGGSCSECTTGRTPIDRVGVARHECADVNRLHAQPRTSRHLAALPRPNDGIDGFGYSLDTANLALLSARIATVRRERVSGPDQHRRIPCYQTGGLAGTLKV